MVSIMIVEEGVEKLMVVEVSYENTKVLNWYAHGKVVIGGLNAGVGTLIVVEVSREYYEMVNGDVNDKGGLGSGDMVERIGVGVVEEVKMGEVGDKRGVVMDDNTLPSVGTLKIEGVATLGVAVTLVLTKNGPMTLELEANVVGEVR
eukprot:Gb_10396 [translate_table: standard]